MKETETLAVDLRGLIDDGHLTLDSVFERANWRAIDGIGSYVACCYGRDGDEPGTVTVLLESAECYGITAYRWAEDDGGGADERGEITLDREAAVEDGESHATASDETPDDDEQITDILAAGWFSPQVDAAAVRTIIDYCSDHSSLGQGHVIIDRDGSREWVTAGYVEHDAMYISIPHGGQPWSGYARDILSGTAREDGDE